MTERLDGGHRLARRVLTLEIGEAMSAPGEGANRG
jgi:hypothetical protein